ncbi:MAG: sigma-54-dependent Fis family transcriptional regulator [Gammaproteobacteria bacterium]|nr:sigma-54-dependent Fis family transcriptional regulator [Gammaproteobacteria bacterium]
MQEQKANILVVEDDADLRDVIADTLALAGYRVAQVDSGEAALDFLGANPCDLVMSDVNMPGIDGYQLLRRIASEWPQLPVLIMTAYGSISNAVEAIRNGAVDFLEKPFSTERLIAAVEKYVQPVLVDDQEPVAEDMDTRRVFQLAKKVAQTDSSVMIMGESGTGKEVLARFIHRNSPRANQPFVAINCAAIPENMLEATLFGHEKGSFTGAHQSSPGKFEQANGGTLLLDEISEMDSNLQAKLLRVLQEKEVERIGGKKAIALDVRVLATTNRNLRAEVEKGNFREDLYYRLCVFPITWRPLRERRDDIIPLALRLIAQRQKNAAVRLDASAEHRLLQHDWPGNIRELDNVIQRALILCNGNLITAEDIFIPEDDMPGALDDMDLDLEGHSVLGEDLRKREFELILETLRSVNGSKKHTAEKLGISPRTLRYKLARMRESGIDVERLCA